MHRLNGNLVDFYPEFININRESVILYTKHLIIILWEDDYGSMHPVNMIILNRTNDSMYLNTERIANEFNPYAVLKTPESLYSGYDRTSVSFYKNSVGSLGIKVHAPASKKRRKFHCFKLGKKLIYLKSCK